MFLTDCVYFWVSLYFLAHSCHLCGSSFGERGNLNQHLTSRHGGNVEPSTGASSHATQPSDYVQDTGIGHGVHAVHNGGVKREM